MKSENPALKADDLPPTVKCTFCGKDAKRTDRRRNGILGIVGGSLLGLVSLFISHWILAFFDWGLPFGVGLYLVLKKKRFVYHCKHCTTVFDPYENVESTTHH